MISGSNEKELDIANQIADLLLEKEKLQQESKQLKSILTELEEWLRERQDYAYEYENVLDKIQKLKEKYK